MKTHFVYIVRCGDDTLYTGYARDLEKRVAAHNARKGAKYTASRLPVTLTYFEACKSLSAALKREHELKRLSRSEKERLISGAGAFESPTRGSRASKA